MLCGKRPFNTLAERQELTDMVATLQRKKKQENTRYFSVDTNGCIYDAGGYGVLDTANLEAIRDCYFSGGPDAALLKYQEMVLQLENDIRKKQQERKDDTEARCSSIYY